MISFPDFACYSNASVSVLTAEVNLRSDLVTRMCGCHVLPVTSAGGGLLEGSHNVPAVTNCHAECDSQFAQNTAPGSE